VIGGSEARAGGRGARGEGWGAGGEVEAQDRGLVNTMPANVTTDAISLVCA